MFKGLITISLVLLVISCSSSTNRKNKVSFFFDGKSYILPNTVKYFKVKDQFKYFVYRGFRSQSDNFTAVLQLDKSPQWLGSENVDESFYDDKKVVGITFVQSTARINLNRIQHNIEFYYKSRFTVFEGTDYRILKSDEGIFIVISQKYDNTFISFYFDLEINEIPEYVKHVW